MAKMKHLIAAMCMALCLISLSVILTLNFKPLYYMDMKLMNLSEETGYSEAEIIDNYDTLIAYNSVFYQGDLEFPTLPMSEAGEIHFVEVKQIFVFFQAVLFPITLAASVIFIWFLKKEKPLYLKWASWLMIGIPAVLGILIAVNWDMVFVLFHKIMFRNDYWIFDSKTDPIINLLPDVFFMHCALMILVLVVFFSALCMLKYKKKRIQIGVLVCCILAVISLVGCDNPVAAETKKYAGKYVAMVAEFADYQISVEEAIGKSMTFEAKEDGTIIFTVGDKSEQGSWEVTGNRASILLADEVCNGTVTGDTIILQDLYDIDASIVFAKEGTEATNPVLYYPQEDQDAIGSWTAYSVEGLLIEGPQKSMEGIENMKDAFSITFFENHTASFTYMGETIENVEWGYTFGDCYMEGGGYNLCAYPVEDDELAVNIYNDEIWYTFHCVRNP